MSKNHCSSEVVSTLVEKRCRLLIICHLKQKFKNLNEESIIKAASGRGKGHVAPCFSFNEPKKTGACSARAFSAAKTLLLQRLFLFFQL